MNAEIKITVIDFARASKLLGLLLDTNIQCYKVVLTRFWFSLGNCVLTKAIFVCVQAPDSELDTAYTFLFAFA